MNATEAKELLKDIPEEQWMTGAWTNYKNKCCAIGHLVRLKSDNPMDYDLSNCEIVNNREVEDFAIRVSTAPDASGNFTSLSDVNDRPSLKYAEYYTPKQRVLAFLDDLIEAGF
jgi:hypothetical protein